jgi:hypothetical protein
MNRVIYSANTVLASDSPGSDNHTGLFEVKNIDRIQSASISINSQVSRYKQIGYSSFLFNNFYTAPEINCEISYYCSDTSNEAILGIPVDNSSIFSSFATTGKDINLFLLSDIEDGRDITSLNSFTGLNVFGVGNAVVTNYSIRGSISEIPVATVSFAANNILFDTYTGNNLVPSLTITGNQTGCRYSITSGVFNKSNYVSNQNERLTAIRPGDIKVIISQPSLAGGVYNQLTGKIQNFQINIPFERKNLLGFGNNFSFDKKLMYPSVGTVSFNALFDKLLTGNYSKVFNLDETSQMQIEFNDCDGVNQIVYSIENAKLTNENFNFDIGSSVNFDGSFEFPIDLTNGFKISGRSESFDPSAIAFLNAININDVTVRSAVNTFVQELKDKNLWYKISGLYPFVGGTAETHKYNLKNPVSLDSAFRLDFKGAGTVHTSSGVEFLGSNDYADTFFYPKSNLTGLPIHVSALSLEDSSQGVIDIGSWEALDKHLLIYLDNNSNNAIFDSYDNVSGRVTVSNVNSKAFYVGSRINYISGFLLLFNSSTAPSSSSVNTTNISGNLRPDYSVYLGNINNNGSPFSADGDRKFGFFSIGDGLTSGECINLYSAVKNLQLNLGRNQSVFS